MGKISTLWWRFLCWNLYPLVRSVIVWICCRQQDFQQALFVQLLKAQQDLQKELQNTKMFFRCFHSEYMYNRNWPKKHFAFWKLFCKDCFAFKSCKNTILLEMLLPAAHWDKEIPYKRGKNSTTWCRFRSCKFKHPFQGLLLSQLFAGKSICSKIVCMQICNAQQLLHKEMRKATFLLKFFHFQLLCLHFTFLLAIACCAAALR